MKKISIVAVTKDNILSFKKYISDSVYYGFTDSNLRILGAVAEEDGRKVVAGAAVLRAIKKTMFIESVIVEETERESYRAAAKLVKYAVNLAKAMKLTHLSCDYMYPTEEFLEAALFEAGFDLPKTAGIFLSLTGENIKEICEKRELSEEDSDQIIKWSEAPDSLKEYIYQNSSIMYEEDIDTDLTMIFVKSAEKNEEDVLSFIVFQKNPTGNVDCTDIYIKNNQAKAGIRLINAILPEALKKDLSGNMVIRTSNPVMVGFWLHYFEDIMDKIDERTIKRTSLDIANPRSFSPDDIDKLFDETVPELELLPRLKGLANNLQDPKLSISVLVDSYMFPTLEIDREDMSPVFMRYNAVEAKEESDDYILTIYRNILIPEDMTSEQIKGILSEWCKNTVSTDAVLDEENNTLIFRTVILEGADISPEEVVYSSIISLNRDMKAFYEALEN